MPTMGELLLGSSELDGGETALDLLANPLTVVYSKIHFLKSESQERRIDIKQNNILLNIDLEKHISISDEEIEILTNSEREVRYER